MTKDDTQIVIIDRLLAVVCTMHYLIFMLTPRGKNSCLANSFQFADKKGEVEKVR